VTCRRRSTCCDIHAGGGLHVVMHRRRSKNCDIQEEVYMLLEGPTCCTYRRRSTCCDLQEEFYMSHIQEEVYRSTYCGVQEKVYMLR